MAERSTHENGNDYDPEEEKEGLQKIVAEQSEEDRKKEKKLEDDAKEDIHTEKIIRQMEDSDLAHKNDRNDPEEEIKYTSLKPK